MLKEEFTLSCLKILRFNVVQKISSSPKFKKKKKKKKLFVYILHILVFCKQYSKLCKRQQLLIQDNYKMTV